MKAIFLIRGSVVLSLPLNNPVDKHMIDVRRVSKLISRLINIIKNSFNKRTI
jgi:hypothetical protein